MSSSSSVSLPTSSASAAADDAATNTVNTNTNTTTATTTITTTTITSTDPTRKASKANAADVNLLPNIAVSTSPRTPVDPTAGYTFYRRIGSPKYVTAPMVNQSELPYRMLTRKYGAQLCYTPMLHAGVFVRDARYRKEHFQTCAEDRPLIVQFCGNDPLTLLAAAQLVQDDCDAVDINLGCPQGIARRGHYGSFLLEEWDLLRSIVSTLHDNLKVPVTCKIRILDTPERTVQLARLLQDSGCALLTVHGRVRSAIKDRVGACDFDMIRLVKQSLHIPVISNGGIATFDDVQRCLEYTACDGVMSSEAILENAALFANGLHVDGLQQTEEYLDMVKRYPGPPSCIRPHLFKFLFKHLSVHTDVRARLGSGKDGNFQAFVDELRERESGLSPEEYRAKYDAVVSWYARHSTHKGSSSGGGGNVVEGESALSSSSSTKRVRDESATACESGECDEGEQKKRRMGEDAEDEPSTN